MMDAVIEIKDLKKSFGDVKALNDISFNVESGDLYGFIGPDGAGKTTLFRIITSLLIPDEGSAKVLGYDVVKDFKKIRTLIGYMPGRFSLYQDLSVEENLKFFAEIFGTTIEKNEHLIKPIYSLLEPFKHRKARALSGGMKQKLALSCALIHKPELLILDEPTTGVDPVSRDEFWKMLSSLKNEGITIIVSTPYMDEALRCSKIALIQKGELLGVETPQKIIDGFTKELFAVKAGNMHALMKILEEYEYAYSAELFGEYVHYVDKNVTADINKLRQYLESRNLNEIEIKKINPGIEDCFISLMKK
jgi:ABC-type multidrug transport system ATPase subunit